MGNFRMGGYNSGNYGNFGGRNNYFGRGNINYPMRMHNGNSRSGYGRGHLFAPNINPNSFQTPRIPFQFIRNGFTGVNGSQTIPGIGKEMTCQICFKSGHTAHICYEEYDNFNYATPNF